MQIADKRKFLMTLLILILCIAELKSQYDAQPFVDFTSNLASNPPIPVAVPIYTCPVVIRFSLSKLIVPVLSLITFALRLSVSISRFLALINPTSLTLKTSPASTSRSP